MSNLQRTGVQLVAEGGPEATSAVNGLIAALNNLNTALKSSEQSSSRTASASNQAKTSLTSMSGAVATLSTTLVRIGGPAGTLISSLTQMVGTAAMASGAMGEVGAAAAGLASGAGVAAGAISVLGAVAAAAALALAGFAAAAIAGYQTTDRLASEARNLAFVMGTDVETASVLSKALYDMAGVTNSQLVTALSQADMRTEAVNERMATLGGTGTNTARRLADAWQSYLERVTDLNEQAARSLQDFQERMADLERQIAEARNSLNEQIAERQQALNDRIAEQRQALNDRLEEMEQAHTDRMVAYQEQLSAMQADNAARMGDLQFSLVNATSYQQVIAIRRQMIEEARRHAEQQKQLNERKKREEEEYNRQVAKEKEAEARAEAKEKRQEAREEERMRRQEAREEESIRRQEAREQARYDREQADLEKQQARAKEAYDKSVRDIEQAVGAGMRAGQSQIEKGVAAFGITWDEWSKANGEERIRLLMQKIQEGYDAAPTQAERNKLKEKWTGDLKLIFGRSLPPELGIALAQGVDQLDHFEHKVVEMNDFVTNEAADQAFKTDQNFRLIQGSEEAISNSLGEKVLPDILKFSNDVSTTAVRTAEILSGKNKDIQDDYRQHWANILSEQEAGMKPVGSMLLLGVSTWADMFGNALTAMGLQTNLSWDGIKTTIRNGINGVIDMLNGIIDWWNGVADEAYRVLGATLIHFDHIQHVGFAGGVRDFMGGYAVVGEQGPELMYVPRGADIYPAMSPQSIYASNSTYNYSYSPTWSLGGVTTHQSLGSIQQDFAMLAAWGG